MSMIFPGMDPYLEDPKLWPGLHSRMVVYLADALQSLVGRRYITAVEERVYLEGPEREIVPDVWMRPRLTGSPTLDVASPESAVAVLEEEEPLVFKVSGLDIHESYITILDRHSNQNVVTVIELVSPANKYAGPGRKAYTMKQQEVILSDAHLVEIDLLRMGPHVVSVPEYGSRGKAGAYDYLVCVNRADLLRDEFEFYPCRLRRKLPRIKIPLAGDDPDVLLDLEGVLVQTYDAASFRDRTDYLKPCAPPLPPDDQIWADQLIEQALIVAKA